MDLGCFFFATEATNLSWFQAQQYCAWKQNGAFLAEIPSAKTQEFIDTILQELGHILLETTYNINQIN